MRGLDWDPNSAGFTGTSWAKRRANEGRGYWYMVYPSVDEIIIGLCLE